MKRQQQTVVCRFYGGTWHNKKGCQWRKFAEEFPPNEEEIPQSQAAENVVVTLTQPEETTQPDDVPQM